MYRVRRTSGRDLSEVRRAKRRPVVDPSTLKKDELVAYATAAGVETTGTKAEILERLEPPTDG